MEKEEKKSLICKVLTWVKTRLSEPSTLTWLVAAAGYVGYTIEPSYLQEILAVCVGLISLIQVIMKDPTTLIKDLDKKQSK